MTRLALWAAPLLAFAAIGVARAETEGPPPPVHHGLYEWMGVAPVVVAASVVVDDDKYVLVTVDRGIKGGTPRGANLFVDLRGANRDRDPGVKPLKLDRGNAYLILLEPAKRAAETAYPLFKIARGVDGARALPLEGREATLDAAARLAELQERHDDALLWSSLPAFLEGENPILLDATLDMYVKFRRGDASVVPLLEPLLEHPRPDVRQRATLLIGRILLGLKPADLPERSVIVGEIAGRARRDEDIGVRRTATAALAPLADAGIDEALRAIARDDPDQDVRFEAERALYERKLGDRPSSARTD